MSLQNLAQQIQSRGRGNDSVLVHMTPHEVGGLQALALAHGGSLTVNPETGLPEAGFLSSLLPMVAGALLAPMTAGTSLAFMGTPMGAALTVGGLTGLATGSLNKGLMAGLGAFGGAGLGAGLMGAGQAAASAAAPTLGATAGGATAGAPLFTKAAPLVGGGVPGGLANSAGFAGVGNLNAAIPNITAPVVPSGAAAIQPVAAAAPVQSAVRLSDAARAMSPMEQFSGGIKSIAANPIQGLKNVYANMPPYTSVASLASTAMGMQPEFKPPKQSKSLIRPYRLDRRYEQSGLDDTGYGTSERRYFDYAFTPETPYEAPGPEYAAGGGLMGATSFANGGYTRYTGTRPLDEYKDDYYYVGGMDPHYMIREGTQGSAGGAESSGSTGPYKYDYDPATGKFTQQAGPGTPSATTPKLSTDPQAYTAEMLNPVYQQYFGRDVDPEGIAAYTARQFSPSELDTILKASPEYAARQQQLAAAKKEASYATKAQAANLYSDLLGRTIDPVGLKYYTEENRMTPADLKKTLMASEEYATKLTKPLAPRPFVTHSGAIGLEGAMRTPEQEAARPRDMSGFYAMMNQRLQEQAQKQGNYAVGGPVEQMSAMNAVGGNTMYPQSQFQTPMYSNPMIQRPMPANVISQGLDAPVDPYTGEQRLAGGGISNLGMYSDGGRLLKGPGDGVSDSIPAVIGQRQPARLADGEFVIPARIVSELGNGSTEAGARKLYAMMDRVQKARKKSVGKNRVAVNSKADKHLPA